MEKSSLDLAAARRLVDEISADLAALPEGTQRHEHLRAEVAQLKALLGQADAHPPTVEAGMRSVHTKVESAATELQSDGVRAGLFLQDIGRMLGLD